MGHAQGRKWSSRSQTKCSRSQTKCSRSQNYAFVNTRCFAKQTKYFRKSETYQTQTIELKISRNVIKQLRNNMKKYYVLISRVYERIISQNTRGKGWRFHLISKHGGIYMSRLRVCTFIWNLGLQGRSRVIFFINENFNRPKSASEMRWILIKIALH